jgi:hypothetical protein
MIHSLDRRMERLENPSVLPVFGGLAERLSAARMRWRSDPAQAREDADSRWRLLLIGVETAPAQGRTPTPLASRMASAIRRVTALRTSGRLS